MSEARRKKTLQASVSDKAVADTSKMVKHSEVLGSMTSRHRPTHPTLHVVNRYGQARGTEVRTTPSTMIPSRSIALFAEGTPLDSSATTVGLESCWADHCSGKYGTANSTVAKPS